MTTRYTLSWEGFPANHGYYCFNVDANSIVPRALFKQGRSYQACVEQGKYSDGCLSNGNSNILSTHRDYVISSPSSILPCIAACKCSLIFEEGEPSAVGSHHQRVNCSCWSGAYTTLYNVVTMWPLSLSSHYMSLFFAVENTPFLIGWLLGNVVLCYFSVVLDMCAPLFAGVDICWSLHSLMYKGFELNEGYHTLCISLKHIWEPF